MEDKQRKLISEHLNEKVKVSSGQIEFTNPVFKSIFDLISAYQSFGKKTSSVLDNDTNMKSGSTRSVNVVSNIEPIGTKNKKRGNSLMQLSEYSQIESTATKKQILEHFAGLYSETNSYFNMPFMKKNDVERFVEENFSVFKAQHSGKYFPINLVASQKGRLRTLVTEFFLKYGLKRKDEKRKYAFLLIHNFEIFKDDKVSSLLNNMQLKKGPVDKNRIGSTKKKMH